MCEAGAGKEAAAGRDEYAAVGKHLLLPQS